MLLSGQGHQSAYTDLDCLALFASLVAYGQIQVENYQYDYDADIREDGEAVRIYQELAPICTNFTKNIKVAVGRFFVYQ